MSTSFGDVIIKHYSLKELGRLCGLVVACWTTDHYHPCSNLGVGISEGCLIFDLDSLPLEVAWFLAYHVHKSGCKTPIIINFIKGVVMQGLPLD